MKYQIKDEPTKSTLPVREKLDINEVDVKEALDRYVVSKVVQKKSPKQHNS